MPLSVLKNWNRFWFEPISQSRLTGPRIAIAAACAIWVISLWTEASVWFSGEGILNNDQASRALDYEQIARWQYWSPLWLTDSAIVFQGWLACGLALSVALGLGVGGWVTPSLLSLFVIATAHRLLWLAGLPEPALIAFCAYLAIGQTSAVRSWRTNASIRLIQSHTWILLAAGLLSKLANLIWWRGEAVWWLASAGRSQVLSPDSLANRPLTVNVLTHGWVTLDILTLWLLVVPSTRKIGCLLGLLNVAAIAFVADQTVYALVLLAGLIAFATSPNTGPNTGDSE